MMTAPADKRRVVRNGPVRKQIDAFLLPDCLDESTKKWYEIAVEREALSLVDCQTIRDLLALGGIDHPPLPLHALLIALFAARNRGSLCLPLAPDALARTFATFAAGRASELARQAQALVASPAMGELINTANGPIRPLVVDAGKLYFQKYHLHERSLAAKLKHLCQTESTGGDGQLMQAVEAVAQYQTFTLNERQKLAVYLACRNRFTIVSGGPGTGKTSLVVALIRALVNRGELEPARVCLIAPTGRAGQRLGESLRASLDLAVPVDGENFAPLRALEGGTIHRVLKYNPSRHAFTHSQSNRLPYDLVVCDEVSMVDVILMDRLLAAVRDEARVVFLGDKDQLPSVEAGAVLGDLVPRDCAPVYSAAVRAAVPELLPEGAGTAEPSASMLVDRVVLLTESHRAKGDVWAFAQAANRGDADAADALTPCPVIRRRLNFHPPRPASENPDAVEQVDWQAAATASCNLIAPGDGAPARLKDLALSWTLAHLGRQTDGDRDAYQALVDATVPETALLDALTEAEKTRLTNAFAKLASARILTVVRRGPFGCETVNRHLVKAWRTRFDPLATASSPVFAGLPIMVTRNDHFHRLYNGDVGIVQRLGKANRYVAVFRRGENAFFILPCDRLPAWEAAFAITVHKSQGSEYGNVLLALPDDREHPLLTREILYTGVTRSKNAVFIFGDRRTLEAAIQRRIQRFSGIEMWGDAERT